LVGIEATSIQDQTVFALAILGGQRGNQHHELIGQT